MKLKGWLIYTNDEAKRNQDYIDRYLASAERHHMILELIITERLETGFDKDGPILRYDRIRMQLPHFVINRTSRSFLAHHLETMSIPVFNSALVSEVCLDKRRTMQLASAAGLPVMPSVFCRISDGWPDWSDLPWQGSTVIKPINGRGGKGVILVRTEQEYLTELNHACSDKQLSADEIIIQQAASDLGRDLRVYVIGTNIEAAMMRRSDPARDFRSNYCLGGEASAHELSHREKSMVKALVHNMDFGLIGIDFIFDHGEPIFNEIEDVVGSRMLYAMTDLDIADRYLEYIIRAIRLDLLA